MLVLKVAEKFNWQQLQKIVRNLPGPLRAKPGALLSTSPYMTGVLTGATRVTWATDAYLQDFSKQTCREHRAVVQAIEAGDPPYTSR